MPNEEAARARREDARIVQELEDMIRTPGWKLYVGFLEKHLEAKREEALRPIAPFQVPVGAQPQGASIPVQVWPDGMGYAMSAEAAKGAIMGLRLALGLPSGIVSTHKAQNSKPSAED